METLLQSVNSVAPVFLIIALGAVLRRTGFMSAQLQEGATRLCYWVGLPLVLFHKLVNASLSWGQAGKSYLVILSGMFACILIALLLSRALKLPSALAGSLIHAGYRGNCAFVGLSVIMYAFSSNGDGPGAVAAGALAAVVLGLIVPTYNITAVIVMLLGSHGLKAGAIGKMVWKIATNPLLLASVAGIAFSLMGLKLPYVLDRTIKTTGSFTLPLALLCVGGALASARIRGKLLLSSLAAVIKVAVAPAAGYLAARAMGMGAMETAVPMIFLATPTAVATYIMTDQLGGDGELAANTIVISTFLSIVSLGLAVALV
ncbi:MAG: AEC family transporter [Planctomycetota bacterium]|nr:AEC family transporter [Planctomycetota bacterium]